MRYLALILILAGTAYAQDPASTKADPAAAEAQRRAWGLSQEQYLLVHPSRRPGGDTYIYWRARDRGPYGNLLERVPGGPRRPVKV